VQRWKDKGDRLLRSPVAIRCARGPYRWVVLGRDPVSEFLQRNRTASSENMSSPSLNRRSLPLHIASHFSTFALIFFLAGAPFPSGFFSGFSSTISLDTIDDGSFAIRMRSCRAQEPKIIQDGGCGSASFPVNTCLLFGW
jgi:hypothetical protein